ncbi:probable palmitoyltransferase ZDHHC20 [Sinocyclocheilus grahami]|uniref:probable palmitoyltransferase ZDHHC20 n=1 Tax=Sinocyclocheilus grahami TaxID=75366 RepID=UPI0007AD0860|nr:PREDICTED: probable palmitoyltransferase ZDHHC20 [Sinocyclocheilus grahami]
MAPSHAVQCCQRGLSWIPVIFINLVVCWSYYAYVVELCIYTISNTEEQVIYLLVFHVFFFMFIWSYWKTIISKPASPSKEFCLPKVDKELYEKEENPEAQQEILKRVARNVLVYTCTGSGGKLKNLQCFGDLRDFYTEKRDESASNILSVFLTLCLKLCRRRAIEHCPENHLPDTHAKFHVLFLFFVAAMFFISILSLFSYHLWLVGKNRTTIEAFRAPVFRNGPDKNGFTLGFRKNVTQVFGDQKKCWCLPIYSSLGDGYTFPTRLVNADSEQGNAEHQAIKCTVDGQANPRPLSESQNHLLGNDLQSEEQKDSSPTNIEVCQPVSIIMENES